MITAEMRNMMIRDQLNQLINDLADIKKENESLKKELEEVKDLLRACFGKPDRRTK